MGGNEPNQPEGGRDGACNAHEPRAGQSVASAMDGKPVRGTIAPGLTQGLRVLAAYLPQEGWVSAQVNERSAENEITAIPRLLRCLDLRDRVVSGDALPAQQELSLQTVRARDDHVWVVKDNQPQLRQDIELLHFARSHRGIENGLHYRRDESLGEDRCRLRTGHAARTMVIINNVVSGLLLGQGVDNVPPTQRCYDAHPEQASTLILTCPT